MKNTRSKVISRRVADALYATLTAKLGTPETASGCESTTWLGAEIVESHWAYRRPSDSKLIPGLPRKIVGLQSVRRPGRDTVFTLFVY